MKETISVSIRKNPQSIKKNQLIEPLRKVMSSVGGVELTTSEAIRVTYFSLSFSLLPVIAMTNNILLIAIGALNFIASCRTIKNVKGGKL